MSAPPPVVLHREKLPEERESLTHKFRVGEFTGYLIVGLSADGRPLEIFLRVSKMGSSVQGFCNAWAKLFSTALQHGVPLKALVDQFRFVNFEPSGLTDGRGKAYSIPDYVVRFLEEKFL